MTLANLPQWLLLYVERELDLEIGWFDGARLHNPLHLPPAEIGNSDAPSLSPLDEAFHFLPNPLQVSTHVELDRSVWVRGENGIIVNVDSADWIVNQVHVHVVQTQVLEGDIAKMVHFLSMHSVDGKLKRKVKTSEIRDYENDILFFV
jgi:hypothetical protein